MSFGLGYGIIGWETDQWYEQKRNRNLEEKDAFLNVNKIIVATLLTDGNPLKPLPGIVIHF